MSNVLKVSVIVPVYNAANYLVECLDSILAQTLAGMEIILVNDGSADNSKQIMEQYAAKDERIIFINGPNEGPGAARNKGIEIARGTYIGFVDADDYIEPTMYKELYDAAHRQEADLGICNVSQFSQPGNTVAKRINLRESIIDLQAGKEQELVHFLHFRYDNTNWNKLYKTGVIKNNRIRFNEKMRLWEDLLFNLSFLQYASTAVTIDKALYNYRLHPASSMTKRSGEVAENLNQLYDGFIQQASQNNQPNLVQAFRQEMFTSCIGNVVNAVQIFSNGKPGFWQFVTQSSTIFKKLDQKIFTGGHFKKGIIHRVNNIMLRKRAFFMLSFLIALRKYSGLKVWAY